MMGEVFVLDERLGPDVLVSFQIECSVMFPGSGKCAWGDCVRKFSE